MMELKEPKRKRRVPPVLQQPFPIPIGEISAISAGHWQVYYGMYIGDFVMVEDPTVMAALYEKGFFGKGSLSRDTPKFEKATAKDPVMMRRRQWERRHAWARKQQTVISHLQQKVKQENRQINSGQVSMMASKDLSHSEGTPNKAFKELDNENAAAATDEGIHGNNGTKHSTTNTSADKSFEMETELVMLESEDETKEATKLSPSEKKYDVILLDSEEEEAISIAEEAGNSKDKKSAQISDVTQGQLASEKEVDIVSEASEASTISLNDSEEKAEVITIEENKKELDATDSNKNKGYHKREERLTDDENAFPECKRRKLSDKEGVNKLETSTSGEKTRASGEDEVILIDVDECTQERIIEGKVIPQQTEMEKNRLAEKLSGEENGSKEASQASDKIDATEKSEKEKNMETKLDTIHDSIIENKVLPQDKKAEETVAGDNSEKCEPELSSETKDCKNADTQKSIEDSDMKDADRNEPEASSSDHAIITEKHEENESCEQNEIVNTSAETVEYNMEVETSDNITKNESQLKAHEDSNEIGSTNGDDEILVVVISDGESDNEEYVKNLNPRLEKEKFPIRETLQLTLEEAFFLSFGLGCLMVVDMCGKILSLTEMWQEFRKSDTNFTSRYIAYHYFRSKGWVVKPGIKFGGDFLLYKQGPAFYHSSYVVQVQTLDGTSWIPDERVSKPLSWTKVHGSVRLAETSGKELMLCQVIKPPDATEESMDSPAIISKFKVHEQLIRRWVSSEERKDDDFSD